MSKIMLMSLSTTTATIYFALLFLTEEVASSSANANVAGNAEIFREHFMRIAMTTCTNCTVFPYVDLHGSCPKTLYSAKRVVQNCSSLQLAPQSRQNWTTLYIDPIYVTELLLQNNQFKFELPYHPINNLYQDLKYLDMSRNLISEYTTDLQLIDCSANYLNDINLAYNLFARFPLFSAACMSLLQRLSLANNYLLVDLDNPSAFLQPVDPSNTRKVFPQLQILDLSSCNIQTLNQFGNYTLLSMFPNLVFLNLAGNRLRQIGANPFVYTPYLQFLSLDNNLLECKLDLRWLKFYLLRNRIRVQGISAHGKQLSTATDPMCYSSLSQTNESITCLADHLFYTDVFLSSTLASSITQPVKITVLAGNTIDLDCQTYSVPAPALWWKFNDRVLSRTTISSNPKNRPYEFVNENFNSTVSPFNKTSILRINNISTHFAGNYSCNAFYAKNADPPNPHALLNFTSITFHVVVVANPTHASLTGSLSNWEIALIVLACVLGFLLLCALLFCCCYCCCYKRGLCCFKSCSSSGASTTSSSSSSSNLYANSKKRQKAAEKKRVAQLNNSNGGNMMEESASGFRDGQLKTRPNYVVNTISKGSNAAQNREAARRSTTSMVNSQCSRSRSQSRSCSDNEEQQQHIVHHHAKQQHPSHSHRPHHHPHNHHHHNCRKNSQPVAQMFQDTVLDSWRILPDNINENTQQKQQHININHQSQDHLCSNEVVNVNINHNPEPINPNSIQRHHLHNNGIIINPSSSTQSATSMDRISNSKYEETMVYKVNRSNGSPLNNNINNTVNNNMASKSQSQIYTIRHQNPPSDINNESNGFGGVGMSTLNEAYVSDQYHQRQQQATMDNGTTLLDNIQTTNPNNEFGHGGHVTTRYSNNSITRTNQQQHYSNHHNNNNNNDHDFSKEVCYNIPVSNNVDRQKQQQQQHFGNNDDNNNNFMKYDSDV